VIHLITIVHNSFTICAQFKMQLTIIDIKNDHTRVNIHGLFE